MKTIKVDKVVLYYMDRVDPDGNLYRFYVYKDMASEIEHIRETNISSNGNTIRMAHEQVAIDFARSEGFSVSYKHNSYGVRYILFTLCKI